MGQAIDALGINLPQLIAQIANFFVLLLILRLVLYKPSSRCWMSASSAFARG